MKLGFYTSLSSFFADLITYPLDTVSTRVKVNTKHFITLKEGFYKIINKEGYKGLYKGVNTTFFCTFIPTYIYFVFYEK